MTATRHRQRSEGCRDALPIERNGPALKTDHVSSLNISDRAREPTGIPDPSDTAPPGGGATHGPTQNARVADLLRIALETVRAL
jgi:hypothetical protein